MKNQDPKQQIVEALKDAENILVTVNANPSVDELSAALGLTLLLNKMDKHATAVFSGDIPPAITFLDPEKTFENTVNSLQDFIIALDKEKADHLRYKVDGDLVKIFITPYRTTISEKDLEFSQGDYNVETVIAIGAQSVDDLDKALADHGRIMHDATVASIGIGDLDSELGSINWHDRDASSYSELLASLGELLRTDKSLLDEQISTAFLTGIVAATERFSNEHTTSKVMTLAAQLMAAGANQQLIAAHLNDSEKGHELSEGTPEKIDHEGPEKSDNDNDGNDEGSSTGSDGSINISHEKHGDVDEVASQVAEERQKEAAEEAEAELADIKAAPAAQSTEADQELAAHLNTATPAMPSIQDELKSLVSPSATQEEAEEPAFGGVLNATTEEAAEEKRLAEEADHNHTLLSHNHGQYVSPDADTIPPVNSFNQQEEDEPAAFDAFNEVTPTSKASDIAPMASTITPLAPSDPVQPPLPPVVPLAPEVPEAPAPAAPMLTLADLDAMNRTSHEDARAAVDAAFESTPAPAAPEVSPMPSLPPMPDFSTLPPLPPLPEAAPTPALPPSPFQAPEPVPTAQPEQTLESLLPPLPAAPVAPAQPQAFDPTQFRIPGQP